MNVKKISADYALSIIKEMIGAHWVGISRPVEAFFLSFETDIDDKTVGYALHTQTSYRIYKGNKILQAFYDIYTPNSKTDMTNFDRGDLKWSVSGASLRDEITKRDIEPIITQFVIKDIDITKYGDLTIYFTNDYILEFFINHSYLNEESESYRYFISSDGVNLTPHIVVYSNGIELHGGEDDNKRV